MTVAEPVEIRAASKPTPVPRGGGGQLLVALVVLTLGVAGALTGHRLVPQVGTLTWAIGLGVTVANLGLLPSAVNRTLGRMTKRLLRIGIVLLGFSVSFASIAALGPRLIAVVVTSLVGTLTFTTWLGRRLGLGGPRSLLIGTGFSICGASAIAAMEETAGADEEDVTVSIAMVTLFGTLALVLLPTLRGPLGLTELQFGVWAGASVHEVGQVIAAASPAGSAAVATAVVVKLTRVVLLAPVVAVVNLLRRAGSPTGHVTTSRRPAIVPLFVLGFLACVAVRSTGVLPAPALGWLAQVQVTALAAALFGMGCAVRIRHVVRKSGAVIAVSTLSTLFIGLVSLGGLLLWGHPGN